MSENLRSLPREEEVRKETRSEQDKGPAKKRKSIAERVKKHRPYDRLQG